MTRDEREGTGTKSENTKTNESSLFPSLKSLRRRGFLKASAGTAGAVLLTGQTTAQESSSKESGKTYRVESTPENIDWGYFDPNRDPVLEIESGDTVVMESLTTMIQEKNHRQFLLDNGVAESNILQDEVVISREEEPGPGHVVTGPIYIENAEPGDILEVHVKDIEIRTPYGINAATTGALPNAFSESETNVIPIDLDNRTVQFTEDIDVDYLDKDITFPVDPFMGIMAVSQRPSEGRIDTIAPSYFGGNMDNKTLGIGSTVYLPVSAEGALFWTGDGHAVQGNGEVCQTALETSLTPTFEFTLHKDTPLDWPVGETDEHYIPMGFSEDLDTAMKNAVREAISILVHQEGLNALDAYRLCSLNVDFNISQVVDEMEIVHAMIPKSMFSDENNTLTPEGLSEGF